MKREIRIPEPEGLNAELYRQWQDGVLRLQRCRDCATLRHPPRYRCAQCAAEGFDWHPCAPHGRLFSWVVTHHPFDRGWAGEAPWVSAIVELDSGVRLVGHLAGADPSSLRLDMPVSVAIEAVTDTFSFLTFRITEIDDGR
ncbi:MAG: OB-fold domain-containing protein [Burkholderiaceae bacterium]